MNKSDCAGAQNEWYGVKNYPLGAQNDKQWLI